MSGILDIWSMSRMYSGRNTFRWIPAILVSALLLSLTHQAIEAQGLSDQVREFLRNRIEAAGIPARIVVSGERIYSETALPRFYQRRGFTPAWIDNEGPRQQIESLVNCLAKADLEGFDPQDYHLIEILANLSKIRGNQKEKRPLNPRRLVDLDLLLTDAFLIYGSHLLSGRVNPESIDPEWFSNRRGADLGEALENAILPDRIEETLHGFLPAQSGYWKLREALARYREIAQHGGWRKISDGPALKKGDRGKRILELRERLSAEGKPIPSSEESQESLDNYFDEGLEQTVREFQYLHGLDQDGVVGPVTLSALNVSAGERVRQLEINMERWRWLPQNLGEHHIMVNMASFTLCVFDNGNPTMHMRVIVGKGYRRTPVFSSRMTYLVLCPYWHVPPSIAVEDKLPLIKNDPDYLVKQNMRVFQGWGADAKEIALKSIVWDHITPANFPYRLRQDPGPTNALGRVKFMFPNRFNVYMHDTPSQELFQKSRRTFSSGCIRIQKPLELAAYLLKGDPRWDRQAIEDQVAQNTEKTIILPTPFDIHLLYWTAFVEQDGTIHFRDDVYGRDGRLEKALNLDPPEPAEFYPST